MYHLNMTELAIHFCRSAGTPESLKISLQNRAEPPYGCLFPSNTNDVTGLLKLSFTETVFNIEAAPDASGRRPMLRPKQNPILLMCFIIRKLTKGGDMVLDVFMGTGATAKAFLLEPRRRNFTGCVVDSECVFKLMPSLFHVFADQVLNPESGITGSEEVQKAA